MKRRQWLMGAVATAATAMSRGAGASAPATGLGAVCAWTDSDVFVCTADGHVRRLPVARAAGVAPAPTRSGIWVARPGGEVERWAPADATAWRAVERHPLDEPVHALAAGGDGQHVVLAHGERISVVASGRGVVKRLDGRSLDRRLQGRAATLLSLPGRRSILASLPALGEMWELSLDPQAAPIHDGLVHDYRMGEALPTPGYLGARRIPLQRPAPDLSFSDTRVSWVAGRAGESVGVVHLDVRRQIATLAMPSARLDRALLLGEPGAWRWWVPAGDGVHCIDAMRWVRLDTVTLADAPAPVRMLQLLGGSPHAVSVRPDGQLRMAVARVDEVELLDAQGARVQRWPVPAGSAVQGVRAMP